MHKINLVEKFSKISEYYKPHIAGELNGQMVKLVKANTEFVWHHHDHEDEMFLVVKGRFRMEYREAVERHEWIKLCQRRQLWSAAACGRLLGPVLEENRQNRQSESQDQRDCVGHDERSRHSPADCRREKTDRAQKQYARHAETCQGYLPVTLVARM